MQSRPIILYGSTLSQPARTTKWFTLLNNLPVEHKLVRIEKGETVTPEFLKMNFNGQIPVLDDNGFTLFESVTIVKYLNDKFKDICAPH
jgi:glutathione S-transferase